eukprot:Amastigsp_a512812_15.p5 type:complete len:107 gc:universal Amastigsp_a512812_15:407-87(-)
MIRDVTLPTRSEAIERKLTSSPASIEMERSTRKNRSRATLRGVIVTLNVTGTPGRRVTKSEFGLSSEFEVVVALTTFDSDQIQPDAQEPVLGPLTVPVEQSPLAGQ